MTILTNGSKNYSWVNKIMRAQNLILALASIALVGCSDTATDLSTQVPNALAGADQSVNEGATVTLDGSASNSPSGNTLSYSWQQVGASGVSLSDASSATATFVPEVSADTQLTFELSVTDSSGASASDQVLIAVNNAPTATISADAQSGLEGASIAISGAQSSDSDGGSIASYSWSQLEGTQATFSSTDSASTSITLPIISADSEELVFQLQVTDNDSATSTSSLTITVLNDATNPDLSAISVAEGSYGIGASATITITAANSESGLQLQSGSSFNGQELTGFAEVTDPVGTYTATYTVASGDSDWSAGSTVDTGTSITLVDSAGNASATITEVALGANTSIDANAPTAKAGNNQTVNEAAEDLVQLDGTSSFDAYDGSIASYSWQQIDFIAAHAVELFTGGTNGDQASFAAPQDLVEDTTLTFQLSVTDSVGNSDTDTIEVLVNNAPTAVIAVLANEEPTNTTATGDAQQVNEGDAITLDGSGSSDSDSDTIASYKWVQVADSSGTALSVDTTSVFSSSPITESIATFTAPDDLTADTTLYFQLTVTDGDGASHSDIVAIAINNNPEVTMAADNPKEANEGEEVTFQGRGTDTNGGTIESYSWIETNGLVSEDDITLTIKEGDGNFTAVFTAPNNLREDTTLTFDINLTDDKGGIGTERVTLLVNNSPTANAGADAEYNETVGDAEVKVTLDGSASSDTTTSQDSSIADYSWREIKFADDGKTIEDVDELDSVIGDYYEVSNTTISFTAPTVDQDTLLTFQLTVTDNDGANHTDTIIVTINNSPTAEAGSDQEVNESVAVTLSGSGSDTDTDSGSSVDSYSWVQVADIDGTALGENATNVVSLQGDNSATATFTAPEVVVDEPSGNQGITTLYFQLTVTDNDGATHSDLVEVAVHNLPVVDSVYLIDGAYGIGDTATVYIRAGNQETGLKLKDGSSFNGGQLESFSEIGDGLYSATYQVLETHDSVINGGEATTNITLVDQTEKNHESEPTTAVTLEGEYIDTVRPAIDFVTIADGAYGIGDEMTLYIQVEGNEAGLVIKDITEIASFNAGDFDGSDFSFNGVSLYTRDDNGDFVTDDDGNYLPIFEDIGNGTYQTVYTVAEGDDSRADGAEVPIAITLTDPAGNDSDSAQITAITFSGESIYANNPTADAGEEYNISDTSFSFDVEVNENVKVTLDGSDSSDTFNSTENLTYLWELTSISGDNSISINSITIDNNTTAHPTFTTPEVNQDTELTFQLTVTDAGGNKGTYTIVITVNGPPTATIVVSSVNGESTDDGYTDDGYLVNEGDTVTLSATGSDDIETYNWTQVDSSGSALESATVSLSIDDDTPNIATFTAPNNLTSDTTLHFQLTVTDDGGASSTATATVLVNNAPDVSISVAEGVSIGGDGSLNINEGDSVTLQGSGSDSAGDTLTYKWEQIEGGTITKLTETTNSGQDYTFTSSSKLSADASYTLRFTVTDEHDASSSQDVVINVNNYPTASASVDPTDATELNEGDSITLDGTGSDTDNGTVTHSWHSVDSAGAIETLANTDDYQFTAPEIDSDTSYTFRYTVTDNDGASTSATDIVLNVNNSPTAVATSSALVNEYATGSLDGSNSSDTDDGSISTYQWLQVDADGNELTDENSPYAVAINPDEDDPSKASFTAPAVEQDETLTFRLTVTDDDDAEASATTSTTINAAPEVSISTSTGTTQITEGQAITLQGTGSDTTTATDALTYQWQQVNADSSTTDLNNPQKDYTFASSSELSADASHTFRFTVTDEHGASDSEDITIDVDNTGPSASIANITTTEVEEGQAGIILDASDSSGGITSYLWQQVDAAGNLVEQDAVTISNPDSAQTTFTAPSALTTATSIYFRLTINDDDDDTPEVNATVSFNIVNSVLPSVTALDDSSADEGDTGVALDISASAGGISSYSWTQIDIGTNPAVTITHADPASPTASFDAPSDLTEAITLSFEVSASDADSQSASDTVAVTINNSVLPTADVSVTTTTVTEGETGVSLDGSASSGGISAYTWEQLSAGDNAVQISNDTSATASFTAPEVIATGENQGQIILTFQLTVDDSTDSSTDTVEITVKNQPAISSVTATAADGSVNDSSKIYAIGDVINVFIQAGNAETGLELGSDTTFNGQALEGFGHINGGLYKATYTVEDGDEDVQSDGSVSTNITLTDGYNASEAHKAVALDGASIDAKAPIITGASILDSGSYTVGDLITIYIYSQESEGNAVAVNANSTVASATLSDSQLLAGSSGNVYTAVYQVQEGDSVSSNTLTASIILTDSAGNDSEAWTTVDVPDNFTIDASSPTQTIDGIELSADTGPTDGTGTGDFITKTASQEITATLSVALEYGDSLYGSVNADSESSWSDITNADNVSFTDIDGSDSKTISWTTNLLEGTYKIGFQVRDSSGNEGEATNQQYTLDTGEPTIALAAAEITANEASTATLEASDSSDNDGGTGIVSYAWKQVESGGGTLDTGSTELSISDASSASTTATTPVLLNVDGSLDESTENVSFYFQLTIEDLAGNEASEILTLTVSNYTTPAITATAGTAPDFDQISLSWDADSSLTYSLYRSTQGNCYLTNYQSCASPALYTDSTGLSIADNSASVADSGLAFLTSYYYWLETKRDSTVIALSPAPGSGSATTATSATTSGPQLNDTGVVAGGDYPSGFDDNNDGIAGNGSSDACNGGYLESYISQDINGDGDMYDFIAFTNEDCEVGRDKDNNDDTDGHAGFSFTRLNFDGSEYSGTGADYTTQPWSCVIDNVTGLVWEIKTTNGGTSDANNQYTWYDGTNGTDDNTNPTTQELVDATNTAQLCGLTNWRLPTVQEVDSLANHNTHGPAVDIGYFPNTKGDGAELYWTAELDSDSSNSNVWAYNAYAGSTESAGSGSTYYVRLVSSSDAVDAWFSDYSDSRYTDNGDGTISDHRTGLMWMTCTYGQTYSSGSCTDTATSGDWEDAFAAADTSNAANNGDGTYGHKDWRLPNKKELSSIVDLTSNNPAINQTIFPNTQGATYWTATPSAADDSKAFTIDFTTATYGAATRSTNAIYVRLVRDITATEY